MLLKNLPLIYRKRHKPAKRVAKTSPVPPVGPLTLVAAVYQDGESTVTLTFDRAVNIDFFDGENILLYDGVISETLYNMTGGDAVLVSPSVVRMSLNPIESYESDATTLTATASNGIFSADDPSEQWAGASDLELPFP